MHSVRQRFNNISAYGVSCLMALAVMVALTDFILPFEVKLEKQAISNVAIGMVPDYFSRTLQEHGNFTFDLDLDATPLFHWNVKVVFLYLTVEYQISSNLIWKQKGKGQRYGRSSISTRTPPPPQGHL